MLQPHHPQVLLPQVDLRLVHLVDLPVPLVPRLDLLAAHLDPLVDHLDHTAALLVLLAAHLDHIAALLVPLEVLLQLACLVALLAAHLDLPWAEGPHKAIRGILAHTLAMEAHLVPTLVAPHIHLVQEAHQMDPRILVLDTVDHHLIELWDTLPQEDLHLGRRCQLAAHLVVLQDHQHLMLVCQQTFKSCRTLSTPWKREE